MVDDEIRKIEQTAGSKRRRPAERQPANDAEPPDEPSETDGEPADSDEEPSSKASSAGEQTSESREVRTTVRPQLVQISVNQDNKNQVVSQTKSQTPQIQTHRTITIEREFVPSDQHL